MRARLARALDRFRWLAIGRRGAFMGGRCMLCGRPGLERREGRVCDRCDAVMWGKAR